jgi:hypothetical protein
VTVGAKEPQILEPVVFAVAIDVIELQGIGASRHLDRVHSWHLCAKTPSAINFARNFEVLILGPPSRK